MDNSYFFQTFFFPTKCAQFFLKIGDDFNSRAKGLELMNFFQ